MRVRPTRRDDTRGARTSDGGETFERGPRVTDMQDIGSVELVWAEGRWRLLYDACPGALSCATPPRVWYAESIDGDAWSESSVLSDAGSVHTLGLWPASSGSRPSGVSSAVHTTGPSIWPVVHLDRRAIADEGTLLVILHRLNHRRTDGDSRLLRWMTAWETEPAAGPRCSPPGSTVQSSGNNVPGCGSRTCDAGHPSPGTASSLEGWKSPWRAPVT